MEGGYVKLYADLIPDVIIKQPTVVRQPEEIFVGMPIIDDAKEVTLAEYSVISKDAITAHHLKDYRQRKFNLILLPRIETLFDKILSGSPYWAALLQDRN